MMVADGVRSSHTINHVLPFQADETLPRIFPSAGVSVNGKPSFPSRLTKRAMTCLLIDAICALSDQAMRVSDDPGVNETLEAVMAVERTMPAGSSSAPVSGDMRATFTRVTSRVTGSSSIQPIR